MKSPLDIDQILQRLRTASARLPRPVKFMEVCGTHTVNAFRSGLHSLLPTNVTLLSGPGCPVCVSSQGDIDQLVELARRPGVVLCTYGDMIRVNGATGSLEQARAHGSDVRVIYSTLDAVKLALANPKHQVVLAAVGFETTAPATAAAVLEADRLWLGNFTVLASHKTIMPAMRALLSDENIDVDGFLCPGHVAVITGSEIFRPVVTKYRKSCVIAGFEGPQIAAAMTRLVELFLDGQPALENLYAQAVTPRGNRIAQTLIEQVFAPADVYWRGLGELPDSGLMLRHKYRRFDARLRYELAPAINREPAGCLCGQVITGQATPKDCKLFGTACTPARAIGPCMVSSEGTCQAWFKYRRHEKVNSTVEAASES